MGRSQCLTQQLREKSFGRMLKFGVPWGGNLCIRGPGPFFSVVHLQIHLPIIRMCPFCGASGLCVGPGAPPHPKNPPPKIGDSYLFTPCPKNPHSDIPPLRLPLREKSFGQMLKFGACLGGGNLCIWGARAIFLGRTIRHAPTHFPDEP